MSPLSPNTSGEMQKDAHWILKLSQEHEFSMSKSGKTELSSSIFSFGSKSTVDEDDRIEVQPVQCEPCDFEAWRLAPHRQVRQKYPTLDLIMLWAQKQEVYLGRRINDEVEMFKRGMKEEFAGLRKDLEAKGLTVRAYVPQAESNKYPRPTHKAIMGGEGQECRKAKTLINACLNNVEEAILQLWPESGCEYGLLAGLDQKLAFVRVPKDIVDEDPDTITLPQQITEHRVSCLVLGGIRNGTAKFTCSEEKAKSFFTSLGKLDILIHHDLVKEAEQAEKTKLKAEKKQAKKHRRQATSSSLTLTETGASEKSSPSVTTEAGEVVKARQRARFKEKKKTQKEKKKKKRANELQAARMLVEAIGAKYEKEKKEVCVTSKAVETNDDATITDAVHGGFVWEDADGRVFVTQGVILKTNNDKEEDVEKLSFGGESSSSSSDESCGSNAGLNGSGREIEVVQIQNEEEGKKAVAERLGRTIIVASQEDYNLFGKGL